MELVVDAGPAASAVEGVIPAELHEAWQERVALMVADSDLPHADAERLAWAVFQAQRAAR